MLGYRRDFTILDREDARDLVGACLGEAEIDFKATRFPKADVLGDIFSLAANTSQPVARLLERQFPYFVQLAPQIEELLRRYTRRKQTGNVMDFDDLLVLWLRLLREQEEVRAHYQQRFAHILVDEYQDTNQLQSDLVDLLAAGHRNDGRGRRLPGIYSWRGANFRNIMRFPERYRRDRLRIETNYQHPRI
jgi:DNA helicase-2/ATP-dependent DNA helicase PcrA